MRYLVVIGTLCLGACAQANNPVQPAQSALSLTPGSKSAATDQAKVCRRAENTGTIIDQRVCRTAAEWDAIKAANARKAERFQSDRSNAPAAPRPDGT